MIFMVKQKDKKVSVCIIGPDSIHTKRWSNWFQNSKDYNVTTLLYPTYKNPFQYIFAMKKLLYNYLKIRKKQDITHIHYIGTFAYLLAPFVKKNLVLSAWGSDVLVAPKESKLRKYLFEKTVKKATFVSAVDKSIVLQFKELGCSAGKIVPLRMASVDTKRFQFSKRSETLRKIIGVKKGFLVLSARWLEPDYNVDVFIKTIPYVLKKLKNIKFVIIGSGSLETKLKNLAKELKVEKNILFTGGVCHKDISKYLASADLYVDPFVGSSSYDKKLLDENSGIGTTTLEAMSCSVPALLANKYRIKDHPYLTYYPLDPGDLADQIIKLLKNKKLKAQMKKKSRDFVVRVAGEEAVMKKWCVFYDNLVNKKSRK